MGLRRPGRPGGVRGHLSRRRRASRSRHRGSRRPGIRGDPSRLRGTGRRLHIALAGAMGSDHIEAARTSVLVDELRAITNVYAVAADAGVETSVFALTDQVVYRHARDRPDPTDPSFVLDHTVPVRPDSQYSLANRYGEAFGRFRAEARGPGMCRLRLGLDPDRQRRPPVRGIEGGRRGRRDRARRRRVPGDGRESDPAVDRDAAALLDCRLRDGETRHGSNCSTARATTRAVTGHRSGPASASATSLGTPSRTGTARPEAARESSPFGPQPCPRPRPR